MWINDSNERNRMIKWTGTATLAKTESNKRYKKEAFDVKHKNHAAGWSDWKTGRLIAISRLPIYRYARYDRIGMLAGCDYFIFRRVAFIATLCPANNLSPSANQFKNIDHCLRARHWDASFRFQFVLKPQQYRTPFLRHLAVSVVRNRLAWLFRVLIAFCTLLFPIHCKSINYKLMNERK